MIKKRIPNLKNNEIKVKSEKMPPSDPNLFQPYCRVSISGQSGTGKSNAFLNAFERLYPYYDKVYIVSPTVYNDPKQQQAFMNRERIQVFDEPSLRDLIDIRAEIELKNEQWREYQRVKKIYDRFVKSGYEESSLKPSELCDLYKCDFNPYGMDMALDRKPNFCLFLDDLQGLDILRHKIFESMLIKLRHFCCNLFVCSQTFKGTSPVFRRNCTGFMIFRTVDSNQLKQIFEEVSGLFKNYEHFLELYKCACAEKHDFLYIDTCSKQNPIRKNFDGVLIEDDLESFRA